ncbi:TPA: hypothetical protein ACSTJZ_003145 [Serratia fonticola]
MKSNDMLKFSGTEIEFDPAELQKIIEQSIAAKYGGNFSVVIHDIEPGDYSDDISIQVIGGLM